jgi:hypothetical protein
MGSSVEESIRKTVTIARTLRYDAEQKQYQNATRVWCRADPAAIVVDIFHEENMSNIWGYVRTTSWDFEGERTDLHEAISIILAAFFRTLPCISCSLWVVPHPAIDIKSEIYARDMLFAQPDHVANTFDDSYFKQIEKILYTIRIFGYKFWSWLNWPLCNCEEHRSRMPSPFLT